MAWGPGGWVKDEPKKEPELGMPPAHDDPQQCEKARTKINAFILKNNSKNDALQSYPQARKVVRVYPPDESGWTEVLYIDADDQYCTAHLIDNHVSISDGW